MNSIQRLGAFLVLSTLMSTASLAAGRVAITSVIPTRLFLDGRLIGITPLQLSQLGRQHHTVVAQNTVTGEQKAFNVGGRRGRGGPRTIVIEWPRACAPVGRPVVVQPLGRPYPTYGELPVAYATPVVGAYDPYATSNDYDQYRWDQERSKVRTRNTLLGAAVANEAFNRGNSKDLLRGVTVGGAILNEIVR